MSTESKIEKLIEGLTDFEKSVDSLVLDVVLENEALVIDMNTQDQLFEKGINAKGEKITPAYTPYTIKIKKEKGQPINRVTLKDEGDFQSSFYLKKKVDEIEVGSSDIKTEAIVWKYGDEIFGLSPENLHEIEEHYIKPVLEAEIKKIL